MYVCIYVCMYVCMHYVWMYVCTCVNIKLERDTARYICVYKYTWNMCVDIYTHIHTCNGRVYLYAIFERSLIRDIRDDHTT